MTPYYSEDGITIYHGDCRDLLPDVAPPSRIDLLLTDPPYGIAERTDRRSKRRSALAAAIDFPAVAGDDVPFDPTHLFGYRRSVLFGANYYADRLPTSSSWLVWDKVDGLTSKREVGFNDNADVELAWTNIGGPARMFRHRWMGIMKASERTERRRHPTQKPVALMARIIRWAGGDVILDPYMGSGSSLVAAAALGLAGIGIELEERYCEVAANRLSQCTLQLEGVS